MTLKCSFIMRRSASAVGSFKLGLLADALKLAFGTSSLETEAGGRPDATAYRVHIHMDKPKARICCSVSL